MQYVRNIYSCAYYNCNANFRNKTKFEIHIRNHSKERPFICGVEDCGKDFASQSHLTRHEQTHEKPLRCPYEGCVEVLKTKATLKKHIDVIHEKKKLKKYQCTICDEQFNKHNWLQRHMFRHTKKYPHVCPVEDCQKGFLMPHLLKRHLNYHKGYPCKHEGCKEVLPKWSLYVKHMKDCHPKEYKCDVCGKVFAHSSNLKSHKAIHAEMRTVYPCEAPNCTRYYHHINNLKYHMKCYHEKRTHVCQRDGCSKAFKTQEDLYNHVLKHDKKKKKKKNLKPTFAAKLAGCVKHKNNKQKASHTKSLSTVKSKPSSAENKPAEISDNLCSNGKDSNELETNNSDYEEITVNIKTVVDQQYLESDVSSCISDSDSLIYSTNERC